jgi:membrane-associated phospholipid phosphatase
MIHPHFNLALIQFFVDHRDPFLTRLFLLVSFLGSANLYVLITIFLFVAWDKRFAIRLSVLILLTMAFNDVLKIFIKNPRPFIQQGTYRQKWAVSPSDANALAAEYSTPSGHAMGSSAFYTYFVAFNRNRFVRGLFVLFILLIGISRPYLGVHYVEDVLLGWAIGLPLALVATHHSEQLASLWSKCLHGQQIAITVAAALALWLLAVALNGGLIESQVREMTAYCGFLTGIVIACPLELRIVNFNPRSCGTPAKILRFAISIFVLTFVLFALKIAFRPFAGDASPLGCALEFIRYVAAEVAAMFLAPLIFCKMKLAEFAPQRVVQPARA